MTPTPVIIAGDVTWGVHHIEDALPTPSVAFAKPKSSTLTLLSFVSATFAGFRSR